MVSSPAHIPSQLVVTSWVIHDCLDISTCTHIVSHMLTRPDDLGVAHGHSRDMDSAQPHHHRRFPRWNDLRSPAWRRQGVSRVCARLYPGLLAFRCNTRRPVAVEDGSLALHVRNFTLTRVTSLRCQTYWKILGVVREVGRRWRPANLSFSGAHMAKWFRHLLLRHIYCRR